VKFSGTIMDCEGSGGLQGDSLIEAEIESSQSVFRAPNSPTYCVHRFGLTSMPVWDLSEMNTIHFT
jgi:hypothetical protein